MNFLPKLSAAIKRDALFNPSQTILVALSGGADSVAMLLALQKLGFKVVAAHCNFQLRGDESERDEQFVRSLLEERKIGGFIEKFDTSSYARDHGISIEMAARRLRYDWFAQLIDKGEADVVAVAHHSEDNIETFFLNLVRGTGLRGLAGMRPKQGRVVRPMLDFSREEIEEWLRAEGQTYVNDSSNADTRYRRNKIRHQLLPILREMNPSFDRRMAETMSLLRAVDQYETNLFADFYGKAVEVLSDGIALKPKQLLARAEAERILFKLLSTYGFPPETAKDMFAHLKDGGADHYEAENYLAVRSPHRIEIRRRPAALPPQPLHEGENRVGDAAVLTLERAPEPFVSKEPQCATIDAAAVRGTLIVRRPERGDRFRPYGLKGSKLLSDFLAERKYSYIDRLSALVVCDDEGILWVVGERIAQRAAVRPSTKEVVCLRTEHPEKA